MDQYHRHIGPAINAASWTMFGLAAASICLRVGARTKKQMKFGWDDVFMFISLVLNLAACVCTSIGIHFGIGTQLVLVKPEFLPKAYLWGVVATDIGILADTFPKVAVALLINRLLLQSTAMFIFTITLASSLVVITIPLIVISFLQCRPISHQWYEATPGRCWSPNVFAYYAIVSNSYSMANDLFFCLYPCVVVARLQMPWPKKVAVISTLSLGLLSFAVTLYKTIAQLPKLEDPQVDGTYVSGQIILWTLIESSVVIIAGSIPTWGWLLGTHGFKRIIGWFSVKNLVETLTTQHAKEPLDSETGSEETEMDRVQQGSQAFSETPRPNYYEHHDPSQDSLGDPDKGNSAVPR